MRYDCRPVLEPALEAIYAVETTGKTAGLERALHHLAAEAERIAESWATKHRMAHSSPDLSPRHLPPA